MKVSDLFDALGCDDSEFDDGKRGNCASDEQMLDACLEAIDSLQRRVADLERNERAVYLGVMRGAFIGEPCCSGDKDLWYRNKGIASVCMACGFEAGGKLVVISAEATPPSKEAS